MLIVNSNSLRESLQFYNTLSVIFPLLSNHRLPVFYFSKEISLCVSFITKWLLKSNIYGLLKKSNIYESHINIIN